MKYKFGKVTNSRLMGTMGLIIGYIDEEDEFYQYFLLSSQIANSFFKTLIINTKIQLSCITML